MTAFGLLLAAVARLVYFDEFIKLRDNSRVRTRTARLIKKCGIEVRAEDEPNMVRLFRLLKKGGLLRPWVELMAQEHYHTVGSATCCFHEECLLEHSLRAALLTMRAARLKKASPNAILRAGVCAFLHDVGKVYARETIVTKKGFTTAFPAHCVVGMNAMREWTLLNKGKLPAWWTGKFTDDMCEVIGVHMCGTHSGCDNGHADLERALPLLSLLTEQGKKMLSYLRVGDTCGSVGAEGVEKVSVLEMLQAVLGFQERLSQPALPQKRKGIFIQLLGYMANGKSTVARWLRDNFGAVVCSKDDIIAAAGHVLEPMAENPHRVFHQGLNDKGQPWKKVVPTVEQAQHVLRILGIDDIVHLPQRRCGRDTWETVIPKDDKTKGKPVCNWDAFLWWVCREWGNAILNQNGIFVLDTVATVVGNLKGHPDAAKEASKFSIYCKVLDPLTEEAKAAPNRCDIPNLEEVARGHGCLANPFQPPKSWTSGRGGHLCSLSQFKPVWAAASDAGFTQADKSVSNPHFFGHVFVHEGESYGYDFIQRQLATVVQANAAE